MAHSELGRLSCSYYVQIHGPTQSSRWARRAYKNNKKACVHPTASTEWARRAHSVLVRLACVHHGQIHNSPPSTRWASFALPRLQVILFLCLGFFDKMLNHLTFKFYPIIQTSSINALNVLSLLKIY